MATKGLLPTFSPTEAPEMFLLPWGCPAPAGHCRVQANAGHALRHNVTPLMARKPQEEARRGARVPREHCMACSRRRGAFSSGHAK